MDVDVEDAETLATGRALRGYGIEAHDGTVGNQMLVLVHIRFSRFFPLLLCVLDIEFVHFFFLDFIIFRVIWIPRDVDDIVRKYIRFFPFPAVAAGEGRGDEREH